MDYPKYGMGSEMNAMEALRLAQESKAFAAQGKEMGADMIKGMAKYGMSDTQIMSSGGDIVEGQKMTGKEKRQMNRAKRKARRQARRDGSFTPPPSPFVDDNTTNLGG